MSAPLDLHLDEHPRPVTGAIARALVPRRARASAPSRPAERLISLGWPEEMDDLVRAIDDNVSRKARSNRAIRAAG
jgi:hypothetical protein